MDEFKEYLSHGRYKEGLNRCDRLLKKSSADRIIYIIRARFLRRLGRDADASNSIQTFLDRRPAGKDAYVLQELDRYLLSVRAENGESTLTAGDDSVSAWKQLAEIQSLSFVPRFCQDRYEGAVSAGRYLDAHHALTIWKKHESTRRDIKFAHTMIYHLVSKKTKDDQEKNMFKLLATRTANQLATSARTPSEMETVISVLVQQGDHAKLLELYNAVYPLRRYIQRNDSVLQKFLDAMAAAGNWRLVLDVTTPLLIPPQRPNRESQAYISTNAKTWKQWTIAHCHLKTTFDEWRSHTECLPRIPRNRYTTDLAFSAAQNRPDEIRRIVLQCFAEYELMSISDMRESVVSTLSSEEQKALLRDIDDLLESQLKKNAIDTKRKLLKHVWAESFEISLDHAFSLAAGEGRLSVQKLINYISAERALDQTANKLGCDTGGNWTVKAAIALLRAHEVERSGQHLALALSLLEHFIKIDTYEAKVLLVYIANELGLPSMALEKFVSLSVKEIQLDTASHIGLTRISIQCLPSAGKESKLYPDALSLLSRAQQMYSPAVERICAQTSDALRAGRPDLMLDLDEFSTALIRSIQYRILTLEKRRLERLTNRPHQDEEEDLLVPTLASWTSDLSDHRDYETLAQHDMGSTSAPLEARIACGGKIPNAAWVKLQLWIDEICCLVAGVRGLLGVRNRFVYPAPDVDADMSDGCLAAEVGLIPVWAALADAAIVVLLPDAASRPSGADKLPEIPVKQALEALKDRVENLPFAPPSARTDDHPPLPQVTSLQTSLLTMDFLKAVQRFCRACEEVSKKRRAGAQGVAKEKSLVKDLTDGAERQFARVREYARAVKEGVTEKGVEATILKAWGRLSTEDWPGGSKAAKDIVKAHRLAWDGVLSVTFQ